MAARLYYTLDCWLMATRVHYTCPLITVVGVPCTQPVSMVAKVHWYTRPANTAAGVHYTTVKTLMEVGCYCTTLQKTATVTYLPLLPVTMAAGLRCTTPTTATTSGVKVTCSTTETVDPVSAAGVQVIALPMTQLLGSTYMYRYNNPVVSRWQMTVKS